MAKQPPPSNPREWVAQDVEQLRAVWDALRPESDDAATQRRFFGRLLTPEDAGSAFERWLGEAFRLSGATGEGAFRVPMAGGGGTREEIDGLLLDGWQACLVEAKFWPGKVDFAPVALLRALIEARPAATLGLFFSPFGYTVPAIESVRMMRPIRVLLFDANDLLWALPAVGWSKARALAAFRGRMMEMVRRKWLLAVRKATPFGDVAEDLALFHSQES